MKTANVVGVLGICSLIAQAPAAAGPALTIYNQDFAVVRDTIALDLKQGVNSVQFTEITAHLEPDSVILRDPTGSRAIQILEQNYRADPVSQQLLLSLYEGQTIDFMVGTGQDAQIVKGRIVRSGYVPHRSAWDRYGRAYYQAQAAHAYGPAGQAIVEVDGKLRFGLPGTPLFPALTDATILKPTIDWVIETDQPGELEAELCYITGGMRWEADYNLISPEQGDVLDLVGWVTMDNQSGRDFENARIKLMAGDVSKIRPDQQSSREISYMMRSGLGGPMVPPVTEKAFDDYHLYSLKRPTTLLDRQTKQVEFLRAAGVQSTRFYVYDGLDIDYGRYQGWDFRSLRQERDYGTGSNPKVWVMREFANSEANHLGMPLPKGRVRFYRRDDDGRLEFVGEDMIDHTPRDETARVYTGNAFDLVGERRRTDFQIDHNDHWVDEAFEITLRNHKTDAVEIRVTEHLYRWHNWEIVEESEPHRRSDSQTMEFRTTVAPDAEKVITYKVHYTW